VAEKKTTEPSITRESPTLRAATAVPFDPASLKGRECRACACYFEQVNIEKPNDLQGFCRRAPAEMARIRVSEPRRDLQGNIVMRDGREVMNPPTEHVGFLFKPALPGGTCFDGWRPIGTLPGERTIDMTMRQFRDRIVPVLADIPEPYRPFLAALFGIDSLEAPN